LETKVQEKDKDLSPETPKRPIAADEDAGKRGF